MFSVKGKLFPAFFMKKSTISPGIARLRDCEIAKLLVCDFCYCGLSGERVKVLAVFPVLNSLMPIA